MSLAIDFAFNLIMATPSSACLAPILRVYFQAVASVPSFLVWDEVDDLLGTVSKLSLCPLARSVVGVCSTIGGERGHLKFAKTTFRSRF